VRVEQNFDLFADYFQFLVRDADAEWEDLADRWTPQAVEAMFIQGDGYVAVGTVRNMNVPVTVKTVDPEPELEAGEWDRIVKGGLVVESGEVIVTGVTDNGLSGGRLAVAPGSYHVRALYGGLATVSADGLQGDDRYVIELWPASPDAPAPTEPEFIKTQAPAGS
jgi:hypothetical protein